MAISVADELTPEDEDLFQHGACHVFAEALRGYFPTLSLELRCVSLTSPFLTQGAAHVIGFINGWAVDSKGWRTPDEIRNEIKERKRHGDAYDIEVEREPVDSWKLWGCYDVTPTGLQLDYWWLIIEPQFRDEAFKRAIAFIQKHPERFTPPFDHGCSPK